MGYRMGYRRWVIPQLQGRIGMNNDYPSYKVSFHGNQHCLWIGKCWVEEGWVCSFWVNTRVSLCSSVASLLIGECWSL